MASSKQGTVNVNARTRSMGKSSTEILKASYPANPVGVEAPLVDDGTISSDLATNFSELCLDGTISDDGHTFGEFNLDFADAPAYDDVETGGGGLPASPWVPNPVSPGPGSQNPADVGDPPEGFGEEPSDTWGTGVGSQLSPAESSAQQSTTTLGDYGLGSSPYSS